MLFKNGTWELVGRPSGQNVIRVRWVYRTKLNLNGLINKYKARLVVKGYAQTYGTDFLKLLRQWLDMIQSNF